MEITTLREEKGEVLEVFGLASACFQIKDLLILNSPCKQCFKILSTQAFPYLYFNFYYKFNPPSGENFDLVPLCVDYGKH